MRGRIFFRKREGFTVVGMLVVLGITSVLSSLFVGYGVNLKDQIALFRDEAQIVQMLFRVKTFAIQVRQDSEGETACAYGLHFEGNGEYFMYSKNKASDGDCSDISDYSYNGSSSKIVGEKRRLDSRVSLSSDSVKDIVFKPPRPEVDKAGEFKICVTQDSFCRGISVNNVGQIDSGKSK